MNAPNPRSLGDFPDDPRFLKSDDPSSSNTQGDEASASRESSEGGASEQAPPQAEEEFQNPMTEEDTASGGPAD